MKNLLYGLVVVLLAAGQLAAEDDFEMVSYQSVLQTLDNQDQEFADLRARLASLESQEAVSTPAPTVATARSLLGDELLQHGVASGGCTAGAGIYYLQPRWGSNPGVASFSPTGSNTVVQNFRFPRPRCAGRVRWLYPASGGWVSGPNGSRYSNTITVLRPWLTEPLTDR